jgi:excisionase family DNA binding protein
VETLYPIDEAAKKLGGVSRHTIVAWLAKGKLRRTKVGHRTMIAESELQRFVRESTAASEPQDVRKHAEAA